MTVTILVSSPPAIEENTAATILDDSTIDLAELQKAVGFGQWRCEGLHINYSLDLALKALVSPPAIT